MTTGPGLGPGQQDETGARTLSAKDATQDDSVAMDVDIDEASDSMGMEDGGSSFGAGEWAGNGNREPGTILGSQYVSTTPRIGMADQSDGGAGGSGDTPQGGHPNGYGASSLSGPQHSQPFQGINGTKPGAADVDNNGFGSVSPGLGSAGSHVGDVSGSSTIALEPVPQRRPGDPRSEPVLVYHGTPRMYRSFTEDLGIPSGPSSIGGLQGYATADEGGRGLGTGVGSGGNQTGGIGPLGPPTPVQPQWSQAAQRLEPNRMLDVPSLSSSRAPSPSKGMGQDDMADVTQRIDPGELDFGCEPFRMAAIRFASPVRLASLRVIPLGVECFGQTGQTDPTTFTAEIFINVSNADPVNALAKTVARIAPAEHALDYRIDMPEEVTTRLLVVRAPARRITMSVYAFELAGSDAGFAGASSLSGNDQVVTSPQTQLGLPSADTLLQMLLTLSTAPESTRRRALDTIGMLAHTGGLDLSQLLSRQDAAKALVALDNEAREAILSVLGLEDDSKVDAVMALKALLRLEQDPTTAMYASSESPLGIVMPLAKEQQASSHPRAAHALSTVIDMLGRLRVSQSSDVSEEMGRYFSDHLARSLPPLAAHCTARGVPTPLPVPTGIPLAHQVLTVLLPVMAEVAVTGESCAPAASQLAKPYLDALPVSDPLRNLWTGQYSASASPVKPLSVASTIASPALSMGSGFASPLLLSSVANEAATLRLLRTLDLASEPGFTSSQVHTPNPAELLAAVAPSFLTQLATAPVPPLGVRSVLHMAGTGRGSGSGVGLGLGGVALSGGTASDFGGKVYSAHEFRRERDAVSGPGVNTGVGRKASRHVDDFKR